jgi:hypothetical protein
MICIEQQRDVTGLLEWSEATLANPLAGAVELRLVGMATRLAFEWHLAELTDKLPPPRGIKWHAKAIRLMKAGAFDMATYRRTRQIARLAAKAVHGKPFCRTRAKMLLAAVREFIG